jgi:hypothetical protein
LKIEQARLEREREETEEEVVAHFQRWARNPAVRDMICGNCLSPEERERRMRAIFGLAPKPESAVPNGNGREEGDGVEEMESTSHLNPRAGRGEEAEGAGGPTPSTPNQTRAEGHEG